VRAGHLSAELDGPDLTRVRWGELEIASRIQVTVRDERWRTLRPELHTVDVNERDDGFTISLSAGHDRGGFNWNGIIRARSDGTLSFEMDAVAERRFSYRRIGICVHHPWASYVGARYSASGSGPPSGGTFPVEIAPQPLVDGSYAPLIPAFTQLQVAFPSGVVARFSFDGEEEGFELEDQRNWTDASFKSYPTPLTRSFPRPIDAGERRIHRLRLSMEGPAREPSLDDAPVVLEVGERRNVVMPSLGVTAPQGELDPASLRELRAAHLRVVATPTDLEPMRRASAVARASGTPLEVALLFEDEPTVTEDVASALHDAPLVRVLALRRDGVTSDGSFATTVRERLALSGVAVCGGTSSHFSELNRLRPHPDGMDAVALAMSPQTHAVDERSMVETLEIQTQVVRQVGEFTGLPVAVSPVTLALRDPPDVDEPIDDRVASAFGAAWTAGSVASLAAAGAASVTLHEAVDRTILASGRLTEVFKELASRRGMALFEVRSSDPRRVLAIAVEGAPVMLVNLTPARCLTRVSGVDVRLGPYEVAVLDLPP
jgi:D-apionolactonase